MLPEPDLKSNFCYEIIMKLYSDDNDGSMPYNDSVECMKQWCLMFIKSPTTLFIEYESKETPSYHYVFLEKKEKEGQKLTHFTLVHFTLILEYEKIVFVIEKQ